jgi:hypothetical protein
MAAVSPVPFSGERLWRLNTQALGWRASVVPAATPLLRHSTALPAAVSSDAASPVLITSPRPLLHHCWRFLLGCGMGIFAGRMGWLDAATWRASWW